MNMYKFQQGFGVIKVLISIPLVLIGLLILAFSYTELNKAYWDYRVKELCEKDGGVTVFETVFITKQQYLKNDGYKGMIRILSERTTKPYHEFYWKNKDTIINKSNPQVVRSEYVTYRKLDEKQLGKWVTYSRRGGDFPTGISHPSSFSCRNIAGFKRSAAKEIFLIEME